MKTINVLSYVNGQIVHKEFMCYPVQDFVASIKDVEYDSNKSYFCPKNVTFHNLYKNKHSKPAKDDIVIVNPNKTTSTPNLSTHVLYEFDICTFINDSTYKADFNTNCNDTYFDESYLDIKYNRAFNSLWSFGNYIKKKETFVVPDKDSKFILESRLYDTIYKDSLEMNDETMQALITMITTDKNSSNMALGILNNIDYRRNPIEFMIFVHTITKRTYDFNNNEIMHVNVGKQCKDVCRYFGITEKELDNLTLPIMTKALKNVGAFNRENAMRISQYWGNRWFPENKDPWTTGYTVKEDFSDWD